MIPHGTQAISFIKACGDHGMQFLQMGDQIFHAALICVPWTLLPCHPIQGQLSVPDYHFKVHYFYLMEALICDCKEDYDSVRYSRSLHCRHESLWVPYERSWSRSLF